MPKNYYQIKKEIETNYHENYQYHQNSEALSYDIKSININDLISILQTILYDEEIKQQSLKLSRKSPLFDKLILMVSDDDKNPWVLRLHTYNVMDYRDGKIFNNLGYEVPDDEINPHFHRWDLTSRFLQGGFNNLQFDVAEFGLEKDKYAEFNLVSTKSDQVLENKNKKRKASYNGDKYLITTENDLYYKGDLVHYPIEIAHKVNPKMAPFMGVTMTLAHTAESKLEHSIFYQKSLTDSVNSVPYSNKEHTHAIIQAITRLKLIKLCEQLAKLGFKRYDFPNSLETELLPTIAMAVLENEFQETKRHNTLELITDDDSFIIEENITQFLNQLNHDEIHLLAELIIQSQENLFKQGFFVKSLDELEGSLLQIANKRLKTNPRDVVEPSPLFFKQILDESKKDNQVMAKL